jgi:hypothetical protein
VRNSPSTARIVEDIFRGIEGVTAVSADPATGGVRVDYEPFDPPAPPAHERGRRAEITASAPDTPTLSAPERAFSDRLVETALALLLEMALQRLLGPFFLPRRC